MDLVLDCGNTALTFATFEACKRKAFFHILTDKNVSVDEYESKLKPLFDQHHIRGVKRILISSVVPSLNGILEDVLERITLIKPKFLTKGIKTGLAIDIDHPSELGSDLVADSVGALSKYGAPCVIADFGTATKWIGLDDRGHFKGVSILPGLMIAHEALIGRASQLMDIPLKRPLKFLGKNTPDSINAGLFLANEQLLFAMFNAIEKELGYPVKKIVTGGYSKWLMTSMPASMIFDPYLNVDGLHAILEKNED